MIARHVKQGIIAIIFFGIVGTAGYAAFRAVVPAAPPATPNPTAHLMPLHVISSNLIHVQNNDYDFVAQVTNPNADFGSGQVDYEMNFYDANNTVISTKSNTFYILPSQTRYIVVSPLQFDKQIDHAVMNIKAVQWQQVDPNVPQNIQVITRNVGDFQHSDAPGVYGKVTGTVVNNSDLDLDRVDVVTVIKDDQDMPIAVTSTQIRTFAARSNRGFESMWYVPFGGAIGTVTAESYTNIFANTNFIRRFGTHEMFQQLY